jgi:hypothetical protein
VRLGDYIRQAVLFVIGVALLIFDLLQPRHDWVTILLALGLVGAVPIEYVVRAGSSSRSTGPSVE